nr:MAG TPA: hypothetical protein [Caudoviricetes sp.]
MLGGYLMRATACLPVCLYLNYNTFTSNYLTFIR